MIRALIHSTLLATLLAVPVGAEYLSFDQGGTDLGVVKWIALVVVVLVVLFVGYQLLNKAMQKRRSASTQQSKDRKKHDEFRQRAGDLGFKQGESRTLERIATRLAPKNPHNLLTTSTGLDYLMADLDKLVDRRRKEMVVLDRIKGKLIKLREQDIHKRETTRVESALSIWVVQKKDVVAEPALVEDEEDSGEDLFENLDSVTGTLLDISEGGAAVRVELRVKRGDRIEFWSADNRIVLSELTAGVVSVQTDEDGTHILHLHFIDPDLRELRLAIADIKARGEAA